MDPQELTRLIREKQSNLDGKCMVGGWVGEGHDVTELVVEFLQIFK